MDKKHIDLITKKLFTIKTEKDILRLEGRDVVYKGEVLTDAGKKSIISQAETIKKMELWEMLQDELKYLACKKMYFDSKTEEDILFGKAILWTIDILGKKVDNLAKLK